MSLLMGNNAFGMAELRNQAISLKFRLLSIRSIRQYSEDECDGDTTAVDLPVLNCSPHLNGQATEAEKRLDGDFRL
jgi:hypothetical protein